MHTETAKSCLWHFCLEGAGSLASEIVICLIMLSKSLCVCLSVYTDDPITFLGEKGSIWLISFEELKNHGGRIKVEVCGQLFSWLMISNSSPKTTDDPSSLPLIARTHTTPELCRCSLPRGLRTPTLDISYKHFKTLLKTLYV